MNCIDYNREKLTKAYEFTLDNVGLDMNSTSVSFVIFN